MISKSTWRRILLAMLLCTISGSAMARSTGSQLALVPATKLPAATQQPASAELLHMVSCDTTYLYLEQDSGRSLLVLDVSDPGHIGLKTIAPLSASSPFAIVQAVSRTEELIQYVNSSRYALLDLKDPKHPQIVPLAKGHSPTRLMPEVHDDAPVVQSHPQDYRLLTNANAIAVVPSVYQQVHDESSGAFFLLGQTGLTVVRDPRVERLNVPCERYSDNYDER